MQGRDGYVMPTTGQVIGQLKDLTFYATYTQTLQEKHNSHEVSDRWLDVRRCDLTDQREIALQVRLGRPVPLVGLIAAQAQFTSV